MLMNEFSIYLSLFWEKKTSSNDQSLFTIFVCEDSKQLFYRLYEANFQFYAEKFPEDLEDAVVS